MRKTAVVTGASSGIGAATARRLAAEGFNVVLAARRTDRLDALAKEITETVPGAGRLAPVELDVTSQASVDALAAAVGGTCHVLVNNAGGALGLDSVATADLDDWRAMYDTNVLGLVRVTKALLPALVGSGAGHVVNITSLAAHEPYEGGGGYNAAKHAAYAVNEVMRLELVEQPVRVTEVAPGLVRTEEFSLVRFRGDEEKAAKPYQGVPEPLVADDVADCVAWAVTRPPHVNIDRIDVQPRVQAAAHRLHRES
ncbi:MULTISPECIES: SDR family NAD(P)-dependent oxidoreductase [Actinomadura]|uniref:SDR family NAD(P)-dependent oxidoreductase n=1 Tax=Actinomadura litoris TaxID=2678616 RepID=A0A7K1LCD7_9ACTN|nr:MULTISPECIES: SDR family NAD(P)-dependent oxidoreductase [Actinomadura]MBT2208251.1 SDR family NAD(P)-dependent oxidoreductase [Actinomadura sp. NEAU-AAG7]MUN42090.1 SDR family NAD(P)-dependent oxidoreductase [Actinomadura litoris]